MSKQKITPCLWFNDQAEEAAVYYSKVFKKSKIKNVARYSDAASEVSGRKSGSVMTVSFELEAFELLGLNGGPLYKFSPAFSFFVYCDSKKEIEEKWKMLSDGGEIRMGLDKYPWAEQYGWTADKFGINWQLILAPSKDKIVSSFLFVDKVFGKGEEALKYYLSIFKKSKIDDIARDEKSKSIMHAAFTLEGQPFVLMEGQGKHDFKFSPATSLMVSCNSQEEIDYYWDQLTAGGTIEQCGWLMDKYGVSWQIIPSVLGELMSNAKNAEKVMKAMLKMKKLDIALLKKAALS